MMLYCMCFVTCGTTHAQALTLPEVVRVLTAADIPGTNIVGGSYLPIDCEPLFAEEVSYHGQPVGLVLATSQAAADRAARLVGVRYRPNGVPVLDLDDAKEQGLVHSLGVCGCVHTYAACVLACAHICCYTYAASIADVTSHHARPPPLMCHHCTAFMGPLGDWTIKKGDAAAAIASAPHTVSGTFHLPSCQHMYMEPQVTVARPRDGGGLWVATASQAPSAGHAAAAAVLGVQQHHITIGTVLHCM